MVLDSMGHCFFGWKSEKKKKIPVCKIYFLAELHAVCEDDMDACMHANK